MKNPIKPFISFLRSTAFWNHCGWLYILIGLGLFFLIDHHQVYLNRMNVLKDVEYKLKEALDHNESLNRDDLRWGLRYYQGLQRYARNNSIYYANLGFCYFYLGEYKQAIRFYQQAIALEQRFYMYHYDLGVIYFHLRKLDQARDTFLMALNYINDSVNYFVEMAEILQGTHGEELNFVAIAMMKRAEEDERDLIIRLIDIYSRSREYDKVIMMAEQGLHTQVKNWQLYTKAGQAAYLLKHYQQARRFLSRAIELEPYALEAYYYRGLTLQELDRESEAAGDFLRLKSLKEQGVTSPVSEPPNDQLHLNIELRVLRQHFG